jgi:hypothetical protein
MGDGLGFGGTLIACLIAIPIIIGSFCISYGSAPYAVCQGVISQSYAPNIYSLVNDVNQPDRLATYLSRPVYCYNNDDHTFFDVTNHVFATQLTGIIFLPGLIVLAIIVGIIILLFMCKPCENCCRSAV